MAAQSKINLLPTDEFERTPLGQFLKWALTIGRYIVIGTELVVILAFLSRFKLDRDLTNLNEKIKGKVAIIQSFEDLEKKTRLLQAQLQNIEKLSGESLAVGEILGFIDQNTPLDLFFADLELDKESGLKVEAIVLSEVDLATFLKKLAEGQFFDDIRIRSITHEGEEGAEIDFSLEARLKASEKE